MNQTGGAEEGGQPLCFPTYTPVTPHAPLLFSAASPPPPLPPRRAASRLAARARALGGASAVCKFRLGEPLGEIATRGEAVARARRAPAPAALAFAFACRRARAGLAGRPRSPSPDSCLLRIPSAAAGARPAPSR
ncbi:hypothetical protein Rsub_07359 [Raphidocelis subcapitata]|uniref:Uncharacterized protein n=1 Tax=Raphidocelis subcapitata TaxID=307507 RepID=A0A2V0P2I7_9CHLO|nr:hypothetical protein Rsub_07359 [Raphidocelis subcapitata]|eukprot:GBF94091.1 hypothetical protein Rsub_07359 [Raphidocelis subcapitata]